MSTHPVSSKSSPLTFLRDWFVLVPIHKINNKGHHARPRAKNTGEHICGHLISVKNHKKENSSELQF